jgi:hypothetical protein
MFVHYAQAYCIHHSAFGLAQPISLDLLAVMILPLPAYPHPSDQLMLDLLPQSWLLHYLVVSFLPSGVGLVYDLLLEVHEPDPSVTHSYAALHINP